MKRELSYRTYGKKLKEHEQRCIVCGRKFEVIHHIMSGNGVREMFKDYIPLLAPVCNECHNVIHGHTSYTEVNGIKYTQDNIHDRLYAGMLMLFGKSFLVVAEHFRGHNKRLSRWISIKFGI